MKIDVTEYEKKYTFELETVTQLCGQNIMKKTYIMESLRRYFSTYKYREEKNKWRDNVSVNDELVGRKYFSVLSISSMSDVLQMIKLSKQSLMMEYIRQLTQKFDDQLCLHVITNELEKIFEMLNDDLKELGDLEMTYEVSNLWEMVQKSNVTGRGQSVLEDKSNYELLVIFLNLLEEILKSNPKKMMVLIENMDHFLIRDEYKSVLDKMCDIGMQFDIYFIVSISLDGYAKINKGLCRGVTIFGDCDFQMPEYEEISKYIHENYPCHKQFTEEQIQHILERVVQRIGKNDFLNTIEENIVCKMINNTLMIDGCWKNNDCIPEIAFLRS